MMHLRDFIETKLNLPLTKVEINRCVSALMEERDRLRTEAAAVSKVIDLMLEKRSKIGD